MLSIRGRQFILYKTQSPIELIAAENVVYKKKEIGLCPFDEKTITFEDDEITYPLTFRSLSKSMAIKSILLAVY